MQITCPRCSRAFETDARSGEVQCPHCGGKLPVDPSDTATISVVAGPKSSLSRAGVVGGVTLAADDAAATAGTSPGSSVEDALSSAKGDRKYAVEDEIARGGMGVILKAIDRDIRRDVAMKLILGSPGEETRVRFIQEAQVTGQLEHPNIVPIHDLGLDEQGRFFFTMKLVKGKSLEEVLDALRSGEREAVGKYTLVHLLNIFTDVCNAMAFAHARGVVHRDLKPANIMLGDFGEVMVMDWGLAKVGAATHKAREHAGRREEPAGEATLSADEEIAQIVSTLRSEAGRALTMDGTIAGTLAYMPPEQARGEISKIDARSDIYSLGAVLYEILALVPPVEGETPYVMLMNVADGNIDPPDRRAPDRHIPKELSAIAMKALATDPKDRYQTVERLRRDVELFLEGRAVSAKPDTAWETVVKLVRRNKGASVATAVATAVIVAVVGVGYWLNLKERRRAENALARYEAEQQKRLAERRKSAPWLVDKARKEMGRREFEYALHDADLAVEYDPALASARMVRPQLLVRTRDFAAGARELGKYIELGGEGSHAGELLEVCRKSEGLDPKNIPFGEFATVFQKQEALVLAAEFARSSAERLKIYRAQIEKAWPGLGKRLRLTKAGAFELNLLKCKQVVTLSPLRGLHLSRLDVSHTPVRDFDGLQGMALEQLTARLCCSLESVSALEGVPLKKLDLTMPYSPAFYGHKPNTVLRSLKGLATTELKWLSLYDCRGVSSLKQLKDLPISWLDIRYCTSLESLDGLQSIDLHELDLSGCSGLKTLDGIQGVPLNTLRLHDCSSLVDLSALRGAPLGKLALFKCTSLATLSGLEGTRLKELDARGCTQLRDLSALKGLPLKRLDLTMVRTPWYAVPNKVLTSLDGVQGTQLEWLGVRDCWAIRHLDPLKGLPLVSLDITGCKSLGSLTGLRGAPITELKMPMIDKSQNTSLESLDGLQGMKLKSLNAQYCRVLRDISALHDMPLEQLILFGTLVFDVSVVGTLRSLTHLDLGRCGNVRDLSPLRQTALKSLCLAGTRADIPGLAGLRCPASVGNAQPTCPARELLSCRHRLLDANI